MYDSLPLSLSLSFSLLENAYIYIYISPPLLKLSDRLYKSKGRPWGGG